MQFKIFREMNFNCMVTLIKVSYASSRIKLCKARL